MATTIQKLAIKSQDTIRDDYLRTYRNALIKRGIANPNVSEGTLAHNKATSLAQQIYVASLNVPLAADAQMADTAQGDDLVRQADLYELALRPAGGSTGPLVFAATVATPITIAEGAQLIDTSGLTYAAVGDDYTDGDTITITSVDTGDVTNLPAGTVLRWVSPPAHVNTTAVVGTGGLTGGVDEESLEGLRVRLLERIQAPPNGSNWASFAGWAEESSTAVEKAFVFPACNGPSTVHVAVTRAPTSTNRNRDVNSTTLSTVIAPHVLAEAPEYVEVVTTTVQNYGVSVSLGIEIPASTKASPPGAGGGWTDGNPFPTYASLGYSAAMTVTSSTVIQVPADREPAIGSTVCWLSTDDWQLRTAKVLHSTGSGPYTITIDTPFVSANGVTIAPGDWVFPHAYAMATYIAAVLQGFAALGPYEKTTSSNLLPRAYRRPLATTGHPSEMKRHFLRNLTDAGDEVSDADFFYRSAITPPIPDIGDGPWIIVPAQVGIYPL